jgi:hypothetical protein
LDIGWAERDAEAEAETDPPCLPWLDIPGKDVQMVSPNDFPLGYPEFSECDLLVDEG